MLGTCPLPNLAVDGDIQTEDFGIQFIEIHGPASRVYGILYQEGTA